MDDSGSNRHPSRESEATNDVANAGISSPSDASSTTSESNDRQDNPRCSVPGTVSAAGLAPQHDKSSLDSGPTARSGNDSLDVGGIILVTGGAGEAMDASISARTSSTEATSETHDDMPISYSSSEDLSSAVDVNSKGEEIEASRELESSRKRKLSDPMDNPPAEQLSTRVSVVVVTQVEQAQTAGGCSGETAASDTFIDAPPFRDELGHRRAREPLQ
jgi:hypothetical protein